MSTTDHPPANHGVRDVAGNRLLLPSFAPANNARDRRPSQGESSTSSSRWSANDRRSRSPSGYHVGSSVLESEDGKQDAVATNTVTRRKQNRSSGGFLLEPTTHSSNLSRAVLSRSQQDVKGKRKNEVSEISVPKRRNRWSTLDQESSVRSSPLSMEVPRDQKEGMNGTPLSPTRRQDENTSQNGLSSILGSQRSVTPSVGFDTDPAQIVDMALKLSEGRRRQASGRRFVSGDVSVNRIISTTSSRQVRTPTKSLSQHITSLNTTSPSPIPNIALPGGTTDGADDSIMTDDPFVYNTPTKTAKVAEPEVVISRATASRVTKAKVYLELAYEHRRLLSHLPPVRRPGTPAAYGGVLEDSKIYNPLQYARNRKLRIRERTTINVEGDGWQDIEKVRAWVDAVIDSHAETSHDPLECVRLPPLSLREDNNETTTQSPQAHANPQSPTQQQNKRRRPKSDWVTHPGDLLADAYWLEQGLNKTKIQDRDNNPIYPPDTPFKFSGWRSRTPAEMPSRVQQPTPPPEKIVAEKKELPLSAAPELPTFKSAHKDESRGRKRLNFKNRLARKRSESRKRKMAMLEGIGDSSSDSDTSSRRFDQNETTRGRKRNSTEFDLPDGDPFARPVSEIYSEYDPSGRLNSSDPNLLGRESNRSSVDYSRIANYLKRNSTQNSTLEDRGRTRGDDKKHKLFQSSRDFRDKHRRGRGSDDDNDSTATDTSAQNVLPSITIDLETPVSRSPSPTKKSKSGILQSLKDKPKILDRNKIEITDFAKRHERSHSRGLSIDHDKGGDGSDHTSRGTSPLTRGQSPFTKSRRESTHSDYYSPGAVDQKAGVVSRQSTRLTTMPTREQPSRIRGVFKGGRIAELVGNEVTRVGDFIWKREIPPAYRHRMSGSEASLNSYDASDTDEDLQNGYLSRTQTRNPRISISSQTSSGRQLNDMSRANEKQQLNNPNLPSFISPFQRDREKQEKKQGLLTPGGQTGNEDHISRQAAQHRKRSKSPRLDRIAPPKLDTGMPQTVGVLERKNSYGFSTALKRPQSTSRSLNDVANHRPGKSTSGRSSATGLPSRLRQSAEGSIASTNPSKLDKRDLSRIEALLVISAVKARNISASYEQIPSEPSKILAQALALTKTSYNDPESLKVRKREEHVLAAQNLISYLAEQNNKINKQLRAFSSSNVAVLHKQIQSIEDQIENTITPRVNIAADNAGALSVKLTTTSTQAVKSTHDVVTEAFRLRKRGPFRWVRLLGYAAIEWFVVGLLWFIWAIVTVIRIFFGLFTAAGRVLKWLLWIN